MSHMQETNELKFWMESHGHKTLENISVWDKITDDI
jgi:hypothetical protein